MKQIRPPDAPTESTAAEPVPAIAAQPIPEGAEAIAEVGAGRSHLAGAAGNMAFRAAIDCSIARRLSGSDSTERAAWRSPMAAVYSESLSTSAATVRTAGEESRSRPTHHRKPLRRCSLSSLRT